MIQIVSTISLDVLKPATHPITIYAKQYDVDSRYVCVHVTNNGEPLLVDSTSTVCIGGIRPDKQRQVFEGTANDDGTVIVPLDPWLLHLVGGVECDIQIETEDSVFSTMPFTVIVRESSLPADEGGGYVSPRYQVASLEEVKSYLEGGEETDVHNYDE